eukprot:scaffold18252_cov117-Skeletonema_dohrnii-CCMP3373.AAC.1
MQMLEAGSTIRSSCNNNNNNNNNNLSKTRSADRLSMNTRARAEHGEQDRCPFSKHGQFGRWWCVLFRLAYAAIDDQAREPPSIILSLMLHIVFLFLGWEDEPQQNAVNTRAMRNNGDARQREHSQRPKTCIQDKMTI